jgi:hypothetical protein
MRGHPIDCLTSWPRSSASPLWLGTFMLDETKPGASICLSCFRVLGVTGGNGTFLGERGRRDRFGARRGESRFSRESVSYDDRLRGSTEGENRYGQTPASSHMLLASTWEGSFMRSRLTVALPHGVLPRTFVNVESNSKCESQSCVLGLNRGTSGPDSGSSPSTCPAFLLLQFQQLKTRFASELPPPFLRGYRWSKWNE